jgi:ureidoacrylate peracid hydrolase
VSYVNGKIALLVIDVQNDFVEREAILEIKAIRENIGKLKKFIDFMRMNGAYVIYTRHCFDPRKNPVEAKLFPELKSEGLRKGSRGWQIHGSVKPCMNDAVIDKSRYDAFYKTNLDAILKSKNIRTLVIAGTMTEVCCESTARSAMFRDYNVIFCSDLNFTSDSGMHKRTLSVIRSNFGEVVSSEEIMKEMRKSDKNNKK